MAEVTVWILSLGLKRLCILLLSFLEPCNCLFLPSGRWKTTWNKDKPLQPRLQTHKEVQKPAQPSQQLTTDRDEFYLQDTEREKAEEGTSFVFPLPLPALLRNSSGSQPPVFNDISSTALWHTLRGVISTHGLSLGSKRASPTGTFF